MLFLICNSARKCIKTERSIYGHMCEINLKLNQTKQMKKEREKEREREQQIDPRITNEIIMLEIGTESDQQKMGKR